jgi:glycosyltransferase involved in cell wall biosynthesis
MWESKKVALIFPTYREKSSIRKSIEDFDRSGYIDEIIVVDNNAEPGTKEEVQKTRAILVSEKQQGYGHAIRKGLASTDADLLIIAEPDGTFDGRDIVKLLAYSDDFEMVFGSRTHVSLIRKGSDMTLVKQFLDIYLAKMATWLFFCPLLTDLGCTLRLTHKSAWKRIAKDLTPQYGIFSIKWILLAVTKKVNYIQIPVNFLARVGPSSLTDTFIKRARWGIEEFLFIWEMWFTFKLKPVSNSIHKS